MESLLIADSLKKNEYLKELRDDELRSLAREADILKLRKGDTLNLFASDYGFYHVLKGKIKVCEMDEVGNVLIKEIIFDSDTFGECNPQELRQQRLNEFAEVLSKEAIVFAFHQSVILSCLNSNNTLAIQFAEKLKVKVRKCEGRYSDLVFHDVRYRFIEFLYDWAMRDGKIMGDNVRLLNYLSHTDIAAYINCSRQSVNKLFNELKKDGIVTYDNHYIIIEDLQRMLKKENLLTE